MYPSSPVPHSDPNRLRGPATTVDRRTLLRLDQPQSTGLWRDAEATIEAATAFLYAAAVMILVRCIARHS